MTQRAPPSYFTDFIAALFVLALAVGFAMIPYCLYKARNIGPAIVFGGFDLILLSGVFDPINTLWLLIPFTGRPLVKRHYSLEHRILRRAGFFVVAIGISYWCGGKPWIAKIQHALWH